ncbi:f1f0 atp synthase assembly protein [Apiospora rasikravindrae]|uniref:F1f0 atp synthase assembly protein n=1 Tax=Apiospora rasikravindrae TaxID=990691 RepID=A0ABR1T8F9_9PEZI
MATLRAPMMLRNLLGRGQLRTVRPAYQQRRWAQVHDVRFQDARFLATSQISRSVTEKYKEKLDRKAKEEGLQDVEQLKAAYADKIHEVRKQDGVSIPGLDALLADEAAPSQQPPKQTQTQTETGTAPPTPPPSPKSSSSSSGASIKTLSEILDLDKARELPLKELTAIWRLRHASQPTSLCAVLPSPTYRALEHSARRYPNFVLPVPRGAEVGAEMHFLQWVFDAPSQTATVLFTQLAEYKARGEWAQPHTSVTHYWDADLARDQGAVLMAGHVVEGRGATIADAQWLVMLLQKFYGVEALHGTGEKRKLLEAFARGDGNFSVEKLLEESEKLG